jgi:hypothetical protein
MISLYSYFHNEVRSHPQSSYCGCSNGTLVRSNRLDRRISSLSRKIRLWTRSRRNASTQIQQQQHKESKRKMMIPTVPPVIVLFVVQESILIRMTMGNLIGPNWNLPLQLCHGMHVDCYTFLVRLTKWYVSIPNNVSLPSLFLSKEHQLFSFTQYSYLKNLFPHFSSTPACTTNLPVDEKV